MEIQQPKTPSCVAPTEVILPLNDLAQVLGDVGEVVGRAGEHLSSSMGASGSATGYNAIIGEPLSNVTEKSRTIDRRRVPVVLRAV
jgi:hypothetical protein